MKRTTLAIAIVLCGALAAAPAPFADHHGFLAEPDPAAPR